MLLLIITQLISRIIKMDFMPFMESRIIYFFVAVNEKDESLILGKCYSELQ